MPYIKVNMDVFHSAEMTFQDVISKVETIADTFADIASYLDWDIRVREVEKRVISVNSRLEGEIDRLKKMNAFIVDTRAKYWQDMIEKSNLPEAPADVWMTSAGIEGALKAVATAGKSGAAQKATAEEIRAATKKWKNKVTLFDCACNSVLNDMDSNVHRAAAAVYEAADIVGTSVELAINAIFQIDDQDVRDDMMVALIKESYMTKMSKEAITADESFLAALETLDTVAGASIPLGDKGMIKPSRKLAKHSDAITFTYNGIRIITDTMENAQYICLMQREYDATMEYLSNLEKSAPKDSSVYRACQIIREEVDAKWPMGLSAYEAKQGAKTAANALVTWKIFSDAEAIYIAGAQGGVIAAEASDMMISMGYYLGDGTAATSVQAVQKQISMSSTGATPQMSSAASVLLAWNIGNLGGKILTNNSAGKLEAEKNLMQLYILNSEVESCMRSSAAETDSTALDVASLYLTTQEAGADEAADYFIHYGGTVTEGLTTLFSGRTYPSEEMLKDMLSSQKDEIDSVRTEIGLQERVVITDADRRAALDDMYDLFVAEGAGDSMELP